MGWHREPAQVLDLVPGNLSFPVWAEPKVDGVRAVAVLDAEGRVSIRSRGGVVYDCPRIADEIEELLAGRRDLVLDGEIAGRDFAATLSAIHIGIGDDRGLRFHVWDALTAAEWSGKLAGSALSYRLKCIEQLLPRDGQRVVGHFRLGLLCRDEAQADAAYQVFRNSGYEGAVYKDLASPYGERWFRRKDVRTFDAPIAELEEGKGRLAGTCGAVLVDTGTRGLLRIGSGLTDEIRRALWGLGERARGLVVEFCQEASPASGRAAPAVFVRMRPDKLARPLCGGVVAGV